MAEGEYKHEIMPRYGLRTTTTILNNQRFAGAAQTHGETVANFELRAYRISEDAYGVGGYREAQALNS